MSVSSISHFQHLRCSLYYFHASRYGSNDFSSLSLFCSCLSFFLDMGLYLHLQCDPSYHTNLVQSWAVPGESCQQQPAYYTWHMVRELVEMHGFNLSVLTDKWTGRKPCCSETCCSSPEHMCDGLSVWRIETAEIKNEEKKINDWIYKYVTTT